MKTCFKCHIEKPLSEYYVHKQMGDGHLNKCKDCTRLDSKSSSAVRVSTIAGRDKERARNREKYYRLNYKEKHKPSSEAKKQITQRYRDNHPEKYKAANIAQRLKPKITGNQLHHWSYNLEHAKDVIELSVSDHRTAHRFLVYDQEFFMYRDLGGNLLNTRELHETYIFEVISKQNKPPNESLHRNKSR